MAGELETVGAEAFDGERLRRPGAVAVAFLAEWCPFCRTFAPEFAWLQRQPGLHLLVADVTPDDSPLWDRFGIDVVPTVIVFHEGKAVFRADGVPGRGLSAADLEAIGRAARPATGDRAPKRTAGSDGRG
ncbi:MAG TPA: thioredoxin family protein [Thermoplasmata archaeon]|nr:thioredoxin family protein [Thermoplasmata archaeon]